MAHAPVIRCLHERRPAVHRVLSVHVCVFVHQQLHHLQLPADRRHHQRRRAICIRDAHLRRVLLHDLLHQLSVSYSRTQITETSVTITVIEQYNTKLMQWHETARDERVSVQQNEERANETILIKACGFKTDRLKILCESDEMRIEISAVTLHIKIYSFSIFQNIIFRNCTLFNFTILF